MPTDEGDEQFLRSLSAAGVEDCELHDLYKELIDVSFWIKAGASNHSLAVATELHQQTWAAVDGSQGVLQTYRGAAAGTTLVGAFFSVGVSKPIIAFRKALREGGLADMC